MRLAALLVTGLLLTTGLVSACGSGSTGSGDAASPAAPVHRVSVVPPRTVVHTYTAYRADGTPTVTSVRTENGYCWDSSLAASGPTAFRCFVAGPSAQILDPCFAPPSTAHPTSVLCVDDPWSRATTLHLTRALPEPATDVAARPWAIQLADGERCIASTGTVPTVAGVNLPYHCPHGTAAALIGTATTAWTAAYAAVDATVLRHTTVTGVWRT